jgi:hypothetical protein
MIDAKIIVGAGVLLGLLMIVAGNRQPKQVANPGTDVVNAMYNNANSQLMAAPALISAAGDATAAQSNLSNQRLQMELAHAEANKNLDLSFLKTFSGSANQSQAEVLGFTGANLADYRKTVVAKKSIASNEKIQIEKTKADKAVAMAQIDLQRKAQDNAFTSSIIGGITGGLNPGQSLTGTGMSSGGSAVMGGGSSGSGSNILSGLLQSIFGGSSGGGLSSLGGGTGGGSQGGGGGSIISSILPAVLALL